MANRQILTIAWPVALSSLSQTLLVNVDFMMVGWVGTEALAAVGQAGTFMHLFLIVCQSLGFGLSTALAMHLGANRRDAAGRMVAHGLLFGLLLGSVLAVGCRALLAPAFAAMDLTPEVRALTLEYGAVFAWTLPLAGVSGMANAAFGAYARTRPVLVASLILAAVNLIGDWALIFGKFGLPALGVRGAAWASVLASAAALAYQLAALLWMRRELQLTVPRRPAVFAQTVRTVLRLGVSTTIEWSFWIVGLYALTWLLAPAGAVHLAVFHAQMKVQSFFMLGVRGLTTANNAMIGRAHGGGKPARVGLWHAHNLRLGVLSLIPGLLLVLTPEWVFALFNLSATELDAVGGARLVGAVALWVLVARLVNTVTGSSLRSVGVVRWFFGLQAAALLLTVFAGWGLTRAVLWGAVGAMLATAADETFRAVGNTWRFGRE